MTDLELMEIHVEVLFIHDQNGRLASINKLEKPPAPRFFLGRTAEGNLWRFRHDLPVDVVAELKALCASEPVMPDLRMPPVHLESYRDVLATHGEIQRDYMGPVYRFPDEIAHPGDAVRITVDNGDLLRPGFADMVPELGLDNTLVFAVVEGGRAVSICCNARTSSRAAGAGVETLEEHRGRGYAARAVAGWALTVRELGLVPLYDTWWENVASQRVAEKLGLILYGVDLHFT